MKVFWKRDCPFICASTTIGHNSDSVLWVLQQGRKKQVHSQLLVAMDVSKYGQENILGSIQIAILGLNPATEAQGALPRDEGSPTRKLIAGSGL